jgi:predicted nicotinamide N-methyase
LPDVGLVDTALPLVPELRLWLMNADYPVGRLSNEATRVLLDDPPYWAFCWGSGAVLARWLLDNPASVQNRTVLDFGSGSGVVGIAAARAGARRVIACDLDPRARLASRANARRNGVTVESCSDYFAFTDDLDVIVAADVLYDQENLPLLAHFRKRASTVLVADSRVPHFDAPGYEKIGARHCLAVPDLDEEESVRNVSLYYARASRETSFEA